MLKARRTSAQNAKITFSFRLNKTPTSFGLNKQIIYNAAGPERNNGQASYLFLMLFICLPM